MLFEEFRAFSKAAPSDLLSGILVILMRKINVRIVILVIIYQLVIHWIDHIVMIVDNIAYIAMYMSLSL